MPRLLRKVENGRWDWDADKFPWLHPPDFPAAVLSDLRADARCTLSVWHLEDDASNLYRIVAVQASGLRNLEKFDYILFESSLLGRIGIDIRQHPGISRDSEAYAAWHWDLVELTVGKIVDLARLLKEEGQLGGRIFEDEVAEHITRSVREKRFSKDQIVEESLRRRLFGA